MASKRESWITKKPTKGETPEGLSLTVPDENPDLKTILERHTAGQGLNGFIPQYTSEEAMELDIVIPDVSRMDTFQKLEHAAILKDKLTKLRARVENLKELGKKQKEEEDKEKAKKEEEIFNKVKAKKDVINSSKATTERDSGSD